MFCSRCLTDHLTIETCDYELVCECGEKGVGVAIYPINNGIDPEYEAALCPGCAEGNGFTVASAKKED